MRVFVSILMILALVMGTSFPAVSHAMAHHHSTNTKTAEAASGLDDCHNHSNTKQISKSAQNDKEPGKCCDEGMCKCIGGTCHSGLSMIFGNGLNALYRLNSSTGAPIFTNDVVESALSRRLKRPPKA